jgi:hypothetical protein
LVEVAIHKIGEATMAIIDSALCGSLIKAKLKKLKIQETLQNAAEVTGTKMKFSLKC